MDSMEETKMGTISEVTGIDPVTINDEEVEPFIVIDVKDGKVRVFLNHRKLYRILSRKNPIENGLNVSIVDEINRLLEQQANHEKEIEDLNLNEIGENNEIRQSNRTGRNSPDIGRSGTEDSNGGRAV